MKLAEVFVAPEAFKKLAATKLPPKMAYRLLKYLKMVLAEFEVIESQRARLIRAAAGAKENEDVSLKPGTLEYSKFVKEFNATLAVDADLKPVDMKLDDLISALDSDPGNRLSAEDLSILEPFFV